MEQEMYREAGYSCGYMLEYMLVRIYEKFKGKANIDILDKLASVIKAKDKKIDTSKLGHIIGILSAQYRTSDQKSNKKSSPVFKIVCETLKIDYNHVDVIRFSKLNDIRNKCVHPPLYNDETVIKKDEIEYFKIRLNIIATYTQHLFHMELIEYHNSSTPLYLSNKYIRKINYINNDIIIIVTSITLALVAIIIYYYLAR